MTEEDKLKDFASYSFPWDILEIDPEVEREIQEREAKIMSHYYTAMARSHREEAVFKNRYGMVLCSAWVIVASLFILSIVKACP